jgi:exosome complex RNA-binding protein Rrp4
VVSDILESNGSSSQATVCGASLALMDAGAPLTAHVGGIAMGLVLEGKDYAILTDIAGAEDHYGDMDFKVAGTVRGITGIQLDLKNQGIDEEIIKGTLEQAREARREILKHIVSTLRYPREEISPRAPRLLVVPINPEKIGMLIGPGGKNIKGIQESTGAKIDIDDDGTVYVSHSIAAGAEAAKAKVEALTEEVRIGKIYDGRVTSVKDFGAFIEILPGRDGLCHISDMTFDRTGFGEKSVERYVKEGQKVTVRVLRVDLPNNRISLGIKQLSPNIWDEFFRLRQVGDVVTGRVVRLTIYDNNLEGQLSAAICRLERLHTLHLSFNKISGALPDELGACRALKNLWLKGNKLTGAFPDSIAVLPELEYLDVHANGLDGALPKVWNTPKLTIFRAEDNRIAGALPEKLLSQPKLEQVFLHNNRLAGPLPLTPSATLTALLLANNVLTGPIPEALGKLEKLTDLRLNRNKLSGAIPASLASAPALQVLRLDHNLLSGPVPPGLGERLTVFDISHNPDLESGQ